MRARRVLLRVQNVAWMEHYHGREARLVGEVVDALEIERKPAGALPVVAYVDDRDGEASELMEAVVNAEAAFARAPTPATGRTVDRFRQELEDHVKRRFLHGVVAGVRAAA